MLSSGVCPSVCLSVRHVGAPTEPEIETRPEPEITTCEEGLGATRSYPTDAASLFTFTDKSETLTIPTSQEVTETSQLTAVQSKTSLPHITLHYNF